jgi:hypothetical protein
MNRVLLIVAQALDEREEALQPRHDHALRSLLITSS